MTYFARILEFHDNKSAKSEIKSTLFREKKIHNLLDLYESPRFFQDLETIETLSKLRCSFFEIIYKYDIVIQFNYE